MTTLDKDDKKNQMIIENSESDQQRDTLDEPIMHTLVSNLKN